MVKVIVAIFLALYVSCSFDYGMIGEEVGREKGRKDKSTVRLPYGMINFTWREDGRVLRSNLLAAGGGVL